MNSAEIPHSYNNIGICLNHLGYPDSVLFYYQAGLELLKDREDKIKADLLHNTGNIYLEKGDLEIAVNQCQLALGNSTSALGALLVHSTLSQIYFLKRNPVNSIESGLTALAYADLANFWASGGYLFQFKSSLCAVGRYGLFSALYREVERYAGFCFFS